MIRKNLTWQRRLAAILLTWLIAHFTVKATSAPADPDWMAESMLTGQSGVPIARTAALAPFLDIVPSQDGTALYISAGGVGELEGTVFVNVGVGPGHDKGSYTMVYSDTSRSYVATAVGFTPHTGASGPINITTTLGLDSGAVDFNRAYVPASTVQTIGSIDGNLELTLVSTDTITFDTYIAIVPSYGPPGPAPIGHRFVGSVYSARAAGAMVVTARPMNLRLHYDDDALVGADPHTLAIFAWDAYGRRWENLGGRLFYDQQYLSVATSRFTTYALMATPAWRDDFDDFSGLNYPAEVSNVTLNVQSDNRALVLSSEAVTGSAVSRPITPTTTSAGWGALTFTCTVAPPTTTLTVDVLSMNGTELLTNVASGTDLTSIAPTQYPALKLRANLSSTAAGETPALDRWQLTWQVEEHKVYLPMVSK